MLITTTVTKTENQEVEIPVPSFYKDGYRHKMLCEDGSIVDVGETIIIKWLKDQYDYPRHIEDMLKGKVCSEYEFIAAFTRVKKQFHESVYPSIYKTEPI